MSGQAKRKVKKLRQQLDAEPCVTREKRYEALRWACEAKPDARPADVIKRAAAYFNFLMEK